MQGSFVNRNLRIILPISVMIAAVVIAAGLMGLKKEPAKKEEDKSIPLVNVEAIEVSELQLKIQSQGIFGPKYSTQLSSQVRGEVVEISENFVKGGILRQGEVIVRVDPTDYRAQLKQAEATLASAKASLELEEAQVSVAKAEWEDIGSSATPTSLSLRKPQLAQAKSSVKAAEAALRQAQRNLERTSIIAPYDALVERRDVSLGSFVSEGIQIGHLLDISKGEIRLPIPNKEFKYLSNGGIGASVRLQTNIAGEAKEWFATIARNEGVVDSESRMVYLVAEMLDPYHLNMSEEQQSSASVLRYGSYVTADINGLLLSRATIVPRRLINDGRLAVLNGGKLEFHKVKIFRQEGANSIVTEGLLPGEQLITTSLDYPIEGMELAVFEADSSSQNDKEEKVAMNTGSKEESE